MIADAMGLWWTGHFSHILQQRPSTDSKHAPVTPISMEPATNLQVWQGSPTHVNRCDVATGEIWKKCNFSTKSNEKL